MIIKKNTIKDVSYNFRFFKQSLDHSDFYTEFIIVIFEYEGDNQFNIEHLELIHPDGKEVSQYNKITTLSLEEAKEQLHYGFHEAHENREIKAANKELESVFWQKIENYINISKSKLYTGRLYGGFTQWCIFWIFIDEKNKKGLLVNAGAWD